MSEILAPAGSKNSALAAINAGADAIYLGLDKFSARSAAENFDEKNLSDTVKYAHAFGVKVYVALNTVVKDDEVNTFLSSAVRAWNFGADALILQDIFLGKFLKEKRPEIKLHLSTQAGVCNVYGARLAKECGFDRVILARETKLSDIAEICKIIETEVFVQGALCTCFSGQCYMSSFAGGNSGNRGKCKQPCRKLYSVDREGFDSPAYRLSLSDLCVGEDIREYIKAGVASFKIEGRMRRPEYVAAAVAYYRSQQEGCNSGLSELKRTYNRGNYTKGLAFGQDKNFISSAVQGHIGEFVGVIGVENGRYVCRTNATFKSGDGFKILRGGKEVGGGAFGGAVRGGFIISTRDRLKNGDKVFITTDAALNSRLLSRERKIPLTVKAEFFAGKPAVVEVNGLRFTTEVPLEAALSRPLSKEDIIRNLKKTDAYPFEVDCYVETDGVFVASSVLNAFRRKIYADYYVYVTKNANLVLDENLTVPQFNPCGNGMTAVIAHSFDGLNADIGVLKPGDYSKRIQTGDFRGEKFLYVPPYLTGEELEIIRALSKDFDGIYCDSYFGLKLAEDLGKKFFAGTGFNITNRVSLLNCKADYVCLSKELTAAEANLLSSENSFYLSEGNIKVMDLIYCPFERKCLSCDRRAEYTLTDDGGRKFPLRRYCVSECRFEVFNCADLSPVQTKSGRLKDFSVKPVGQYTKGHSVTGIY